MSALSVLHLPPGPGVSFERWQLVALVGEGGGGSVYRAVDRETGDVVAVKLLRGRDAVAVERFAREARILADLGHPSILRHVAHGVAASGEPYLVMEWLEGENLAVRLSRGPLGIDESVTLARLAAEALGAAHARGVIHRDVKPSNLFLVGGAVTDVRVLDFGAARVADTISDLTRSGTLLGTPGYMAPEQARGEHERIDASADVYSLGAVLFHCLTGQAPFSGAHVMEVLAQVLLSGPPRVRDLRPEVPEALAALVGRLLASDPSERPPNGAALVQALAALGPLGPATAALGPGPALAPSISGGEQRLLARITVDLGPSPGEEAFATVRSIGARLGAQVGEPGGSAGPVVMTLTGPGSATDLAARAARCALRVRAALPGAAIALAMGHGERGARPALEGTGLRPGAVHVDDVTRALLDDRFEVRADPTGLVLAVEHEIGERARTLLGRPMPYVGRDRELQMLARLFDQTIEGELGAQAAVVTAPAGMGKTRLRQELVRHLRKTRPNVGIGIGRADAMSAGASFGLAASLIRTTFGAGPDDAPAMVEAKAHAYVGRLLHGPDARRVAAFLGEMVGMPSSDDLDELRAARQSATRMAAEIGRAFVDLLRGVCALGPVLLVLEDVHWGDYASIQLIDQALRDLEEQPLMVLGLARPEVDELFPGLWAKRGVQTLRLGALPRRAAEELVTRALDAPVPPADLARICDQAGGNAFYLEELIRAYAAGTRGQLPETVLGMVEARLEGVPVAARRLLRAASIFGDAFPAEGALALLSEADRAEARSRWLPWLVGREILLRKTGPGEEDGYVFRHALLREGSYAMLTDRDRKAGHVLAGGFLARAGGEAASAALVGEHLFRGEAWDEASSWLDRAGDAAARLDAHVEARAHYQRALEAMERAPDGDETRRRRVDTMIKKAEISYAGDPGPNLALLGAARALALGLPSVAVPSDDYRRLARVHYWMGRCHYYRNENVEALGYYQRVLAAAEALGDEDLAAQPSATIGRVLVSRGQFGRAMTLLERSLGPLERSGIWADWIVALGFHAGTLAMMLGRGADAIAQAERALARAEALGNPTSISVARSLLGIVSIFAGAPAPGYEHLTLAGEIADRAGDGMYAFIGRVFAGWAACRLGRHDAAAAEIARARAIMKEMGRRLFFADWFDAFAIEADARAGRFREAIEAAEHAVPGFRAAGSAFAEALAQQAWGLALLGSGQPSEARDHLAEAVRLLDAGDAQMEAARARAALDLATPRS